MKVRGIPIPLSNGWPQKKRGRCPCGVKTSPSKIRWHRMNCPEWSKYVKEEFNVKSIPPLTKTVDAIFEEMKDYEINHPCKIPHTQQCEQAPALGSESERKASGARRPLIGFTLYRVKLLDWEAKYSSVKDLLDGCVSAGLLDGDREDQIDPKSFVIQKKVDHYAQECTVIELTF